MVEVQHKIKMVHNMKENISMVNNMDKEHLDGQMVLYMQDNGKVELCMVKVFIQKKMELYMKVKII